MNEKQQRDLERTKLRNKRARIVLVILALFGLATVLYAGTKLTRAAVAGQAALLVCTEASATKDLHFAEIGAHAADLEETLASQADWIQELTADSILTEIELENARSYNEVLTERAFHQDSTIIALRGQVIALQTEAHGLGRQLMLEMAEPIDTMVIVRTKTITLPPDTVSIEVRHDGWVPTPKDWLGIVLGGGVGFILRSLFETDDHQTVTVDR